MRARRVICEGIGKIGEEARKKVREEAEESSPRILPPGLSSKHAKRPRKERPGKRKKKDEEGGIIAIILSFVDESCPSLSKPSNPPSCLRPLLRSIVLCTTE